jgi:hypothetical protein
MRREFGGYMLLRVEGREERAAKGLVLPSDRGGHDDRPILGGIHATGVQIAGEEAHLGRCPHLSALP